MYGSLGIPVVYAQPNYVNGYQLAYASTTTATLAAGLCMDSTVAFNLSITSPVTLSIATNGVNGLDTGTVADSTMYAVYVIGDSRQIKATAGLISANPTTPVMPYGYDLLRRVGWLLTSGSATILLFYQNGNGSGRTYYYDTAIRVLNAGAATSATAVTLQTAMPLQATPVILNWEYVPAAAANVAVLQVYGSTAAKADTNTAIISGPVMSVASFGSNIVMPTALDSGNPAIQYIANSSDALTLWVAGYLDYL